MSESQSNEYVEDEDQSRNEYDNVEVESNIKETETPYIDEELKNYNFGNLGKYFWGYFFRNRQRAWRNRNKPHSSRRGAPKKRLF